MWHVELLKSRPWRLAPNHMGFQRLVVNIRDVFLRGGQTAFAFEVFGSSIIWATFHGLHLDNNQFSLIREEIDEAP